jgi:hypothetical protein
MTRLLVLALVAIGCWALAAWATWAVVYVGTRDDPPEWDEPDDGVQPPDPYSFVLADTVTGTVTGATDVKFWYYDWGPRRPD